MNRTDTEMSGLQKPKPENLCMSVKASTMHASMCFAKADTCSGNWLTASCATTKVPISNLRGAIVSRAQQRADPNAVCAQFSKTISKNVIADNAELAENFAETVKNEIASDDDAYAHIGFHPANDIRNQSPASEVLLTLCGRNINTPLDKTPPIAIRE